MRYFSQHFAARPIGQGFFYTGKLTFWVDYQTSHYNFVFDCGTMDKKIGDIEVEHFRNSHQLDQRGLDLLIISHFDKDHISHIKSLIQGVKIKRIVMPFLGFEERLFLALRLIEEGGGPNGDNDGQIIRFILDPIGEMGDSLDGGTEIYLVDADPDGPQDSGQLNRDKFEDTLSSEENPQQVTYEFDFPGKQLYIDEGYFGGSQTQAKVFKVRDSLPALLTSKDYYLMDFHFYKKKLGKKDEMFFREVRKLFEKEFTVTDLDSLKRAIVGITSAKEVKIIFGAVAKSLGMKIGESRNLNTTSLCMLHRNLKGIMQLFSDIYPWKTTVHLDLRAVVDEPAIPYLPLEKPALEVENNRKQSFFPNTLLTSDSFLLNAPDLKAFEARYATLFSQVFLAQIPHHGSKHSSDRSFVDLIKKSSPRVRFFCNYGLENKFNHPSDFWKDMLFSWHTAIYPVHQIIGLSYLNRYLLP